jgi:DNA-binding SARP family transcriptional activator/tetratricopeptide (TPR) repeat protein
VTGAVPYSLVRVLGTVELVTADGVQRLGRLERTLLAVLAAYNGRLVTADRLIDALWEDSPPDSARNRVQRLVSSIRQRLTDELIVTRPPGYLLDLSPDRLDVARFERLVREGRSRVAANRVAAAAGMFTEALSLWRGAAFDDVTSPVLEAEATRLDELRRTVREELVDARLALGEHADLVAELTGLAAAEPFRDRLRGQLMLALYRCGRQADALEVYRRGAAVLAEEHGLDPPEELRRLYAAILREDAALAVPAPLRAPPQVTLLPSPAPNQLPASIADFVGRAKEIQQLRTLLAEPATRAVPGACAIVSVAGMAGVGKTALAVRVAHEIRDRFPGGCLYADLRGVDASPASPLNVLGSFLRAYGLSGDTLPDDLDERAALYRTVLSDRQVLVVLDNAADERQVRPLVPGGGSLLVTSRRPLAGLAGAHLFALETLSVTDSLDLLARIAGAARVGEEPSAAERIVRLCGQLPLAIRIAGVRLAQHEPMAAASLGDLLTDERRRLDELVVADLDVRASLEVGYRRLEPAQARLLGRLSLLPLATYAGWLGGALLDAPADAATQVLERLCEAQLVSPAGTEPSGAQPSHAQRSGARRYRLHDLVRLHARDRAESDEPAPDRSAAVGRAYAALLAQARLANARLPCRPVPLPLPDASSPDAPEADVADPLDWFEAERENLVLAVEHSVALGRTDLAWQLAASAVNFFLMRGYVDDWERSHRLVLGARHLEPAGAAAMRLGLGLLLRLRDRNREAVPHLRYAYRQYRACGDRLGMASAAFSWGVAARMLGNVRFGSAALELTARLLDTGGPPTPMDGYLLMARHQIDRDEPMLRRALAIFEELGETWGAAEALGYLATFARKRGDYEEAVSQLRTSTAIYARLGDLQNRNQHELTLAHVYVDVGAIDLARPLVETALGVSRELRHPWGEAFALQLTGRLHLADGQPEEAISYLDRAVAVLDDIGQPAPAARAMMFLAQAHDAAGDRVTALRIGHQALDILNSLGEPATSLLAWLSTME